MKNYELTMIFVIDISLHNLRILLKRFKRKLLTILFEKQNFFSSQNLEYEENT